MGKFANSLWKGLKVAAHVVVGSVAYGAAAWIGNFHPDPATIPGLIWNTAGIGVATGLVAFLGRWAGWDPSKAQGK